MSFLIANTFLAYILGMDEVVKMIKEPIANNLGLLTGLIFFTLLFYGVFAFVPGVNVNAPFKNPR